jgi:hypothetical protein
MDFRLRAALSKGRARTAIDNLDKIVARNARRVHGRSISDIEQGSRRCLRVSEDPDHCSFDITEIRVLVCDEDTGACNLA